ncbi:MAG: biotin/lipoate A/B protein ligase family protein [Rubripirellula sp.]
MSLIRRLHDQLIDPADHLALDEAMLIEAENESSGAADAIRIWEFASPIVVAGRSTRVDREIDRPYCERNGIPILRRCSGGASVVGGPGCLMYSVVMNLDASPAVRGIDQAHRHVMGHVLEAVQVQLPEVTLQGICDLTWQDCKFSGNSLRITRAAMLYHGTILYDFDLDQISRCLQVAPRQPEYRQSRDHASFVTNVPLDPKRFATSLDKSFGVVDEVNMIAYSNQIRELRSQRYDSDAWNFRH